MHGRGSGADISQTWIFTTRRVQEQHNALIPTHHARPNPSSGARLSLDPCRAGRRRSQRWPMCETRADPRERKCRPTSGAQPPSAARQDGDRAGTQLACPKIGLSFPLVPVVLLCLLPIISFPARPAKIQPGSCWGGWFHPW